MDILKFIRKLAGLHKLAKDQAGTPEGDTAQSMMDKLLEGKNITLPEGGLDHHETTLKKKFDWDGDLAQIISRMTRTEAVAYKIDDTKILFRGLRVSVEEAEKHFLFQRDQLERLLGFVTVGYMMGAFGKDFLDYLEEAESKKSSTVAAGLQENADRAEKAKNSTEDPTAGESASLTAAAGVGKNHPVKLWESLKL